MILLLALLMSVAPDAGDRPSWTGVWTDDVCHEDRKPGHDQETFCRQGRDRIRIERDASGVWDITLCPADPWGERNITVEGNDRVLAFRSREGYRVRLTLGEDRAHYRGLFRGADGHSGRIQGRRVTGCG